MTTVFKEISTVKGNNSGLISLGDISEDTINHRDEHSVFQGLSGITDDGDDVGSLLSHSDQISTRTVGEFDGIYNTFLIQT